MKLLKSSIILILLGMAISCQKSETTKSSEAKLLKVSCSFVTGSIDSLTNTVTLKVPENTDLTQIIPKFEISKNATIYPPSGAAVDLTNAVSYTISSEDNSTKYVFKLIALKPIVKFTVYDCSNWSITNPQTPQTDATIKLYTSAENVGTVNVYDILITDQNAEATLYGLSTNNYYITVEKDDKTNIINGYAILGRYNSQAEVDSSPDTSASIGSFKYLDLNGDARINLQDKTNFQVIMGQYDLNSGSIYLKDLFIAN